MPEIKYGLCELDGHEFLTTEDSIASVDYDLDREALPGPYNPDSMELGKDRVTGVVINTVTFRGENILSRLTDWDRELILKVINTVTFRGENFLPRLTDWDRELILKAINDETR